MISRFLFGDDIFISYSRTDGAKYAAALASELSNPDNGFSCFLDQWGASAADKLSIPVLRAISRSSVLVLIGTSGAMNSPLVRQEVELFARRRWFRSHRPILPVNIDGALSQVAWTELTGLYRVPETDEARNDGTPSKSVVKLIANSHTYTKRAQRTRWLSTAALFLLVSSILASIFAAYQARQARAETQRANAEAERANQESRNAIEQTGVARKNKLEAEQETENAKASAAAAELQRSIATEKTREAETQAALAKENATIARAQELSAHANTLSPHDPEAGLLAAMDAVRVKATAESEDALRKTLLRFPEQEVLSGSSEEIRTAEFSPEGQYIITTSFDGTARLYDVSTGKLIKTFDGPVVCAVFSPNGKYIVLSHHEAPYGGLGRGTRSPSPPRTNYRFTQIVSLKSTTILHELLGLSAANVAFSFDGRFAILSAGAIRGRGMTTTLWTKTAIVELETGRAVELPEGLIRGHAIFTADNRVLSVGTESSSNRAVRIHIVDRSLTNLVAESVTKIDSFNLPKLISSRTNDQRVVAITDYALLLIDSKSASVVADIRKQINAAAFSGDGQLIAAGGNDGVVNIYSSATGESLGSFRGHPAEIKDLCFSRDDKNILVVGNDNVARVWMKLDLPLLAEGALSSNKFTFRSVGELTGHAGEIGSLNLNRDGNLIVTGSTDGTARIWNTSIFAAQDAVLATPDDERWEGVAFSPSGDRLVANSRQSAQLWNTKTGARVELVSNDREIALSKRHLRTAPIFRDDGELIIIQVNEDRGSENNVELYDSNGTFLTKLPGKLNPAQSASFSADGKFVVLTNGEVANIWSISEIKIIKTIGSESAKLVSAAFSPDGKSIVTCSKTGTVRLWSFPDLHSISTVQANTANLHQVGFSPNSRYVFLGDGKHKQSLWDTFTRRLIPLAGAEQTVDEWGFSDDSNLVFRQVHSHETLIDRTKDGTTVSSLPTAVAALSANGKFAIDRDLMLWEVDRGEIFSRTLLPYDYYAVGVMLRDGKMMALSDDGRLIRRSLAEIGSIEEILTTAAKRTKSVSKRLPEHGP